MVQERHQFSQIIIDMWDLWSLYDTSSHNDEKLEIIQDENNNVFILINFKKYLYPSHEMWLDVRYRFDDGDWVEDVWLVPYIRDRTCTQIPTGDNEYFIKMFMESDSFEVEVLPYQRRPSSTLFMTKGFTTTIYNFLDMFGFGDLK